MAKTSNLNKAYELYKQGLKLVEIASQLNVPEGTVRSWKSRYKWDDNSATLQRKKRNVANKNRSVVIQPAENTGLNDRQLDFCRYYVKYRNKTKAYMKAYNCSYENADANAYKLWDRKGVTDEINRLLNEFRSNIDLDIVDLFQWYLDIALADINDFVSIKNNRVVLKNGADIDGTLISEIREGQFGISVKLQDKHKALQWLGEHIGLASEEQQARINKLNAETNRITGDDTEIEDLSETDADIYG